MRVGKINELSRRLELQELARVPDGAGGFEGQWKTLKHLWGNIKMLSSTQNSTFNFLEIKATHLITLRKQSGVTINMRFLHNNDIYNIKYLNDLDNYFLEVICEKVT
ncbi:MAG: phage head closure protein [Rickettsiales bacterium]|jgi:SPP1 family predicted phage head-tail adaptor|nr:phage head closure protein [Rickettsiales bacterium]